MPVCTRSQLLKSKLQNVSSDSHNVKKNIKMKKKQRTKKPIITRVLRSTATTTTSTLNDCDIITAIVPQLVLVQGKMDIKSKMDKLVTSISLQPSTAVTSSKKKIAPSTAAAAAAVMFEKIPPLPSTSTSSVMATSASTEIAQEQRPFNESQQEEVLLNNSYNLERVLDEILHIQNQEAIEAILNLRENYDSGCEDCLSNP